MSRRVSRRETAARAVYALRPFRTAMSTSPLESIPLQQVRLFGFDEAPAYYVDDCYMIADAVIAALDARRIPRQIEAGK